MSESTEDTTYETLTDPKHFSRLLYTNPVCFLTTVDAKRGRHNSMVISWLTPINNHGVFIMAVNKMRCTASLLLERRSFGLSVAVRGQEAALLAVGRCHGHNVDKFAALKLTKLSLSDAPDRMKPSKWFPGDSLLAVLAESEAWAINKKTHGLRRFVMVTRGKNNRPTPRGSTCISI